MPFYGAWINYNDEVNPLTRKREVTIILPPEGGQTYPALFIRCRESTLEFIVAWAAPGSDDITIGGGYDWTTVQHRIGDEPIEMLEWTVATNKGGTFLPDEIIMDTIRRLYSAEEFVVQVIPDQAGPITTVFEPAGIYWAVKPVLEACGVEIN